MIQREREISIQDVAAGILGSPASLALQAGEGRWRPYPHLIKLNRLLVEASFQANSRLLVTFPPRHGKSEMISRYFPAWYLGMFPNRRIMLASYEASFAASWGRKARDVVEEWGARFPEPIQVRQDSSARDDWNLVRREGGMVTAGAGGGITGKGAHLAIIDDPIKNAEEARSKNAKDKIWDWYTSTFRTRLHKGGSIVVVMTRWAEDDLAGRLIAGSEKWNVVKFPAISPDGAALCEDLIPLRELRSIQQEIGNFWWQSLYQQEPYDMEGGVFKPDRIRIIDAEPVCKNRARGWDFAATEAEGADFTAGAKLGVTQEGRYVILNVRRGRWSALDAERNIRQTAELDGKDVRGSIPQDPGAAGKAHVANMLSKVLAGLPYTSSIESGDKVLRAMPFAAQVEAGNVDMVRGDWNAAYLDELRAFPNGSHDDQVDASSRAFAEIAILMRSNMGLLQWMKDKSTLQGKDKGASIPVNVRPMTEVPGAAQALERANEAVAAPRPNPFA